MTNSEKWALGTLGVIALTVVAYFTFVALRGSGPASQSVFALLALTCARQFGGRRCWCWRWKSVTTLVLYRKGSNA